MEDLSVELKKIILMVLPRITIQEIRILTDRDRYLPVLGELKELQNDLEREILEEEKKTY